MNLPPGDAAPSSPTPAHLAANPPRLPYSSLGISLGFAGLGSAWRLASLTFGLTGTVSEVLFVISACWWAVIVVARLPVNADRVRQLMEEIRHPVSGPFPAYVPVIALLLTAHYAPLLPPAFGELSTILWVAILTIMCAQMLAFWLSGRLRLEDLHPGYSLPVIAGPFIAAMTLVAVGYDEAGLAAAAVGGFYWFTLGGAIFIRLLHGPPLVAPLRPTLTVLVTPPVTAGLAWFALQDGRVDPLQIGVAGIVTLLLAMQAFILPTALRGPFHLGFWALSFPAGALASYALRWAVAAPGTLADVLATAALALASAVILALVGLTAVTGVRRRRHSLR